MLFSLKQVIHTQIALTKCYKNPGNIIFLENLQETSADTYLIDTWSIEKEPRSGIINFWLVVYSLSQF